MRKLFFGGSFNPIHHGHLICARAVAEAAGYERIVLVPTGQPPHKPASADLAPAQDRAQMCRLATQDDPLFDVDDLELHQAGPSYTLDTVRALRQRGQAAVHWLIGADMLAWLPKWHRVHTLVAEARLIIMARPGWTFDWNALPEPLRHLRQNVIEAPLLDISATDLRARLRAGRSIRYFTPDPVIDHIRARHLYGA
jgi:nicotinate-nucleotide adenylyltransferase